MDWQLDASYFTVKYTDVFLQSIIIRTKYQNYDISGATKIEVITLKCLSIGTPKIINFPFVSNGKLMIFRCPNIQTDYNEAVLCLNWYYRYYRSSS